MIAVWRWRCFSPEESICCKVVCERVGHVRNYVCQVARQEIAGIGGEHLLSPDPAGIDHKICPSEGSPELVTRRCGEKWTCSS
ncbi:hypothetical protein RSOLAG1IB_11735 [Rhizoctonia solani AG-1 IB]|uniref:Uncharacterized protein n=1 Tax=Thanatephorus cucumeris (strain AG1-IB / isolate 7/3/14) TaxID=1108050 RepID=A0A0B7FAU4_THACB|nr:hypothetical protein RSOLAG1IB_11735 [Rhizoctonia solani AG-1 IB]